MRFWINLIRLYANQFIKQLKIVITWFPVSTEHRELHTTNMETCFAHPKQSAVWVDLSNKDNDNNYPKIYAPFWSVITPAFHEWFKCIAFGRETESSCLWC